jgi:hypothetical protein
MDQRMDNHQDLATLLTQQVHAHADQQVIIQDLKHKLTQPPLKMNMV